MPVSFLSIVKGCHNGSIGARVSSLVQPVDMRRARMPRLHSSAVPEATSPTSDTPCGATTAELATCTATARPATCTAAATKPATCATDSATAARGLLRRRLP